MKRILRSKTREVPHAFLALAILFLLPADTFAMEILGTGIAALLGNDRTDPENDGTQDGDNYDATFFSSDEPGFGGGEFAFNVFDNEVGGGNAKWCCGTTFPQIVGAIFDLPVQLTHFTVTSGNDSVQRDPVDWEIQGSNDTTDGLDGTWTTIFSHTGSNLWTARNQVIRWDEVTDFPLAPPYLAIRIEVTATGAVGGAFFQINELEFFGSAEVLDDDMDGLDDNWETAHGLDPADDGTVGESAPGAKDGPNGALGDPDGDTLTNLEEFTVSGTHPNEKDTDGDGLDDNVETNDGTFDDLASDTGTDPNNPDTDGDGLPDGVETNDGTNDGPTDRGTNPLLADTDGDGASDGVEINLGTDPLDPNSTPFTIEILGIGTGALLGGDLTDVDDLHDELAYNPPGDFGGFDATFTASKEPGFGGGEFSFNLFDNEVGGGNAKFCCEAPPLDITAEFAEPVSLTHFTLTSSNDSPGRDPLAWSIQGSNNGVDYTPIYEHDEATALWDQRNQVARITLGGAAPAYKFLRLEVTRVGSANVFALNEIEYFGSAGKPAGPQITAISPAPGDQVSVSWESGAGLLYRLRSETDPAVIESTLPADWTIVLDEIVATPPENTALIDRTGATGLLVVESFPAPPESVFSDDFEAGQGAWTTTSEDAVGTEWELGAPDNTLFGGPPAPHSGTNVFGTDLDANYIEDTLIRLRSPAIDLAGVASASVIYWQWRDIEVMFDAGQVRLLDSSDLSELAVLESDLDGSSNAWEQVTRKVPAAALDKSVILEFILDSDNFGNQAGWYIDDVSVTVP